MHTTLKAVSVAALLLLSLVLATTVHAALSAVGPADVPSPPGTGFPAWYQDSTGLSLAPCFDTNGFCAATMTSGPGFNAAQSIVFPTNFPEEFFYYLLFADVVGSTDLLYEAAIEGAFANAVQAGDQMVFARIRIRGNVTTPGTYTITHPYGVETFNVTAIVNDAEINFLEDVGVVPGVFTGALAGRVDPFVVPVTGLVTAPDGNVYAGDPSTAVSVTGSPTGNNFVRITGPGLDAQTNLFIVEGKVVGNDVSPKSLTFPSQKTSVASEAQTVTVTNISTSTPLTVAVTVEGTDLNDFQITSNNCTAPVPASGTCTFGVVFSSLAPTPADRTASALITTTSPAGMPPMRAALSGTIDSVAPTVVETQPANGQTIPINSTLTAVFSEPMAAATINAATFVVTGSGGAVAGAVTYDNVNNTVTFIPASLASNATYTATITTGATDRAGNGLAADHVFTFAAAAPDATRPTVVSVSPAGNSLGVAVNAPIMVTFSEEMDASSINAATFLVSGVAASSITYDTATNRATFTPNVNLASGTAYTVTIKGGTGGVDDLAQNPLLNDYMWVFITNNPPAAPVLVSPGDGATGLSTSVTLTWAKATDDDGDALTYQVYVCSNQFFIGCNPNIVSASSRRLDGMYFAGLGGFSMALIGLFTFGGTKGGKGMLLLLLIATMTGAFVYSCGESGVGKVKDDKIDTTPPTVPTEVTATAVSATQIILLWTASSDDVGVAGYTIYQEGAALSSIATGTAMVVTGLSPATNYCYTVNAHDAAGNASAQSDPACATTQAGPAPSSNEMSFTATGLNPGTLYFWRVEVLDPNGGATFSEARSFRTQ